MRMTRWAIAIVFSLLTSAGAMAQVSVVDGDTLDIGATRYRIHGIDAPEHGQKCSALGDLWPCGRQATARLAALIEGARVTCDPIEGDGRGRTVARCFANGADIGAAMVESGFAWAFARYSDDYLEAEARARQARRGVWRGPTAPAWEYRAERWRVAEQTAPAGCPIKGNISRNGRIYHPPWSPWYSRTKISPEKGERWFCSEDEAVASGWRAPRWR